MEGRFPLPVGSRGWRVPAGMTPLRLPAQLGQAVVGESRHQGALARAAGGRTADVSDGHFENAIPVTAGLVPEPGNPDDSNAVAVTVADELVGYLPEAAARAWQPALLRAWRAGRFVVCAGSITGGGPLRWYGIYLSLSRPIDVDFVAAAPVGTWPVLGSATVTVIGEEEHEGALAALRPHQAVAATLHRVGEANTGRIEVRIRGNRVGELTAAMSERFLDLVTAAAGRGLTLACRAHVGADHRGTQVMLSLPTTDELAAAD